MSEDPAEPDPPEPLADLADRVGKRRGGEESDADDPFAEVAFEELGETNVWDAIEADRCAGAEIDHAPPSVDANTTVVSKREFCEQCHHFAEPPEARCTHDGTDIREFVDRTRVRVSNCPIVEQRGLSTDMEPE